MSATAEPPTAAVSPSSTPEPIVTVAPSAEVARLIELILSGDGATLETMTALTAMPCSHETIMNPAPNCAADEGEGALVDAFFIGFCPAEWIRPVAGKPILIEAPWHFTPRSDRGYTLYAVVPSSGSRVPDADTVLLFRYEFEERGVEGFYFDVRDGKLVSSWRTCGDNLDAVARGA